MEEKYTSLVKDCTAYLSKYDPLYLVVMANILIFKKEEIIKKIFSYDRRTYESIVVYIKFYLKKQKQRKTKLGY